jgi:hypothetical protein
MMCGQLVTLLRCGRRCGGPQAVRRWVHCVVAWPGRVLVLEGVVWLLALLVCMLLVARPVLCGRRWVSVGAKVWKGMLGTA